MEKKSHSWSAYIDGASRNNPGKAGAGVYITKDGETVINEGFFLGIKTNNQAEYLALLLALYFLKKYADSGDTIRIASDSELLVKQINGIYRIKNEGLHPLFHLAQQFFQEMQIELLHVLRHDNKQADLLANKGIDTAAPLPSPFIALLEKHNIPLT